MTDIQSGRCKHCLLISLCPIASHSLNRYSLINQTACVLSLSLQLSFSLPGVSSLWPPSRHLLFTYPSSPFQTPTEPALSLNVTANGQHLLINLDSIVSKLHLCLEIELERLVLWQWPLLHWADAKLKQWGQQCPYNQRQLLMDPSHSEDAPSSMYTVISAEIAKHCLYFVIPGANYSSNYC